MSKHRGQVTQEQSEKRKQQTSQVTKKHSDALIRRVCRRYLNLYVLGYWTRSEVIERVAREQGIKPTQVLSILMTYLHRM